jgi:hypothetical protein
LHAAPPRNHYAPPFEINGLLLTLTQFYGWLTVTVSACHAGKEAAVASRDKPGKEKRKPKKDKVSGAKPRSGSEVIEHVQHHGQTPADKGS